MQSFQLKYSEDFSEVVRDIPHFKCSKDIPEKVLKFIENTSNNRVIYDKSNEKFYCGKCTRELDSEFYCKKCNIKHKKYNISDIHNWKQKVLVVNNLKSVINRLEDKLDYFVFDVVRENVYLYLISERIYYYNPMSLLPYKSSKIYIDTTSSYFIQDDGVINLSSNVFTSFKVLKELSSSELSTDSEFNIFEEFILNVYDAMLYTDNLEELKNTIYKYSKIWRLKEFLKDITTFNISQFIMPLYIPSFEYLINYKLYNLAWSIPDYFTKGKNFKEIFGVDKKYLPFMVSNNISSEEFQLLKVYPTTDIEVLKFFNRDSQLICDLFRSVKLDLKKVKDYLEENKLNSFYVIEYLDYIRMAKELKLDLKDKNILYPKDFMLAHDEIYNQIEIANDPKIDDKIKSLSILLSLNRYEDNEYVIYPASSIMDLVDESRQQKNCVRTYLEFVANNESQIYFMRRKSEIHKSYVTIEVRDKKIVQAKLKYNNLPSDDINQVLAKWEKTLIPITNKEI